MFGLLSVFKLNDFENGIEPFEPLLEQDDSEDELELLEPLLEINDSNDQV